MEIRDDPDLEWCNFELPNKCLKLVSGVKYVDHLGG